MGGSVKMIDWPARRKAIEIGNVVISNDKIKKILNWKPKIEIDNGLNMTADYYKIHLDKYLNIK